MLRFVSRWTLSLLVGLLLALTMLPRSSVAQTAENRVGLVVKFGNGAVFTGCYAYRSGMTGLDLLRAAQLDSAIEYSNLGAFVCRLGAPGLGADGCNYPAEDCLCQARTRPWRYWAYWRLNGDNWAYSDRGAAGRALEPGAVDGWAWGEGSGQTGERPPVIAFQDICPAPTLTPPPTSTHPPPPLPTPEPATPTPTLTLVPPTLTLTVTPVLTPQPTQTFTPVPSDAPTITPEPSATTSIVPVDTATVTPELNVTATVPAGGPATPTPVLVPTVGTPSIVETPTSPPLLPSATPGSLRTATASPTITGPIMTATPIAGSPASPTISKREAGTLTPIAISFAGQVDLSRLTPVPTTRSDRGPSSLPFGYAIFAAMALGLVIWLLARQRGT